MLPSCPSVSLCICPLSAPCFQAGAGSSRVFVYEATLLLALLIDDRYIIVQNDHLIFDNLFRRGAFSPPRAQLAHFEGAPIKLAPPQLASTN